MSQDNITRLASELKKEILDFCTSEQQSKRIGLALNPHTSLFPGPFLSQQKKENFPESFTFSYNRSVTVLRLAHGFVRHKREVATSGFHSYKTLEVTPPPHMLASSSTCAGPVLVL